MQIGENLKVLLRKLRDVTGEPITAEDIQVCERVPVAKRPSEKNIVVLLTRLSKRNMVLEKTWSMRCLPSDLSLRHIRFQYMLMSLCAPW